MHAKLDKKAYNNMRAASKQLVADEAADEGRARELLTDDVAWDDSPDVNVNDVKQCLPNAQTRYADKAQSSKRILSRLWNGIPACKDVMDRMIRTRKSPAKIIHNSVQFQEQYTEAMVGERSRTNKKLKDLGMSAPKTQLNGTATGSPEPLVPCDLFPSEHNPRWSLPFQRGGGCGL